MRTFLALSLLSVSACSFVRMRTDSDYKPTQAPGCSEGTGPVVFDLVVTGLGGLVAAGGASNTSQQGAGAIIAGGITAGAVFLASAVYGLVKRSGCEREWTAWNQESLRKEKETKAAFEAELAARPPEIRDGIHGHRYVVGMFIKEALLATPFNYELCRGVRSTSAEAVIEDIPVCTPSCALCDKTSWRLHFKDGQLVSFDEL